MTKMYEILTNIMNKLGTEEIIFSNEQDLQFELSKRLIHEDEIKDVKLEVLSTTQNWNDIKELAKTKSKLDKEKKDYTDIIITTNSNKHYAIELKYKTPEKLCYYETKNGKMFTMPQGAHDIGAYDFINDISRLENINSRFFSNHKYIEKGYAIILTNDRNYRYNDFKRSPDKNGKHNIWANYSIDETRSELTGKLRFYGKDKKSLKDEHKHKKNIYKALELKGKYNLSKQWNDYPISNYKDTKDETKGYSPGFSYLIIETKCK